MRSTLMLSLCLLLAGCTVEVEPVGGDGSALPPNSTPAPGALTPQTGHQEAADERMSLAGDLRGCDEGYCIDATATNEGSEAVYVSNICVSSWTDSMRQAGSDVPHREPMATCLAWGVGPMAAGAVNTTTLAWDGKIWDDDEGKLMPGVGEFQWSVHFTYYEGGEGSDRHELTVTFPVIIGET